MANPTRTTLDRSPPNRVETQAGPGPGCDDAEVQRIAREAFRAMVDSVGVKRFAADMDLSTRQVNRILSGAQPNPIDRLIRCLLCCDAQVGDRVLDLICQEMGGYFVREETIEGASVNAVRECAEAIAAISDGHISQMDEVAIRDAVSALTTLARTVQQTRPTRRKTSAS